MIRVGPDELDLLRFEALGRGGAGRRRPSSRRDACARLSTSGAGRRSPTSPTSRSRKPKIPVSKSSAWRRSSGGFEADLALGRYAELVGEVQALVREHPLRERLRAVLMQALYGSGRQAEALEVYRETRRLLVDELGIEPSPALHELEQAILRQDPALTSQEAPAAPRARAIMVVATDPERLDDLLAIAEPLARRPARELILARLLRDDGELAAANAALSERRDALAQQGVASRIATYTTSEPGADVVRLATEHDVDLILLDAASELLESGLPTGISWLSSNAHPAMSLSSQGLERWPPDRS